VNGSESDNDPMSNSGNTMQELLANIRSDTRFRPDEGAFRTKLIKSFLGAADEEFVELFSDRSSDILVSVSKMTAEEGIIRFWVFSDLGEQTAECALSEMNDEEITDLTNHLSRLVTEPQSPHQVSQTPPTPKVVVRKKPQEGMFGIQQVAQKLGRSQIIVKSTVPCSDYAYREVDGKKEITDYYWSQKLVERLCSCKLRGVTADDVTYIARECCDGDDAWAKEILVTLGCSLPTTGMVQTAAPNTEKVPSNNAGRRSSKVLAKILPNPQPPPRKKR
jgi:hypothetical protein